MPKFLVMPTVNSTDVATVRLGSGTGSANWFNDNDRSKFIKLVADSRYDLCAAGDDIEAYVTSVDVFPSDNYSTGGRGQGGFIACTFDGAQATPGTGTVAALDYVVCGTVVARNTSLAGVAPKVCTATTQATAKSSPYASRVISLGTAATGAVGTSGVIEHMVG